MVNFHESGGITTINRGISLPNTFDQIDTTPAYPAQSCMKSCVELSTCGIVRHTVVGSSSRCTRYMVSDTTYTCHLRHSNVVINGSIGELSNVTSYSLEDCKNNCATEESCIGVNFKEPKICIPIHARTRTTDTYMWLNNKTELDNAPYEHLKMANSGTVNKSGIYILLAIVISWMSTL